MRARLVALTVLVLALAVPPAVAQPTVAGRWAHPLVDAAVVRPTLAQTEMMCAPRAPRPVPPEAVRVIGGLESQTRRALTTGEHVVLGGGSDAALQVGQAYFVRRLHHPLFAKEEENATIETAGWVQIESVQEKSATARVVWACDAISEGDHLEPFQLPNVPPLASGGQPNFEATGTVLTGRDGRETGAPWDRVLIEIGDTGVTPGARVALFRYAHASKEDPGPITPVGEGHVLEVDGGTAMVRIEGALLDVRAGDRVVAFR